MKVTVVGMGHMGSAMAERLAGAGHEVRVWNRSPGKAGDAVAAGAIEAGSLDQAVTGAEAVITMLAEDQAVRALVLGDGGLAGLLEGSNAVYIDSSTVSPDLADELAARIIGYAAMPVLGSPDAVRSGQAALLLGGAPAALDRARPVAAAISERTVELDSAAKALAGKLTANYLLLAGLPVLAEAFAVGRAGGLDDADLSHLLAESPLVAPGLRNRFDAVLGGVTDGWFSTVLGGKDVGLALALAAGRGCELPVGRAVRAQYEAAATGAGLAEADVASVGRLYRHTGDGGPGSA